MATMTQQDLSPTKIIAPPGGTITGTKDDVYVPSKPTGPVKTWKSRGKKWVPVPTPAAEKIPEVSIPDTKLVVPDKKNKPKTSAVNINLTNAPPIPTTTPYTTQGTSTATPATMQELARLDELNQNALTADWKTVNEKTAKVQKSVEKIEQITKEGDKVVDSINKINAELEANIYNLNQYDKYINEDDKFVGTKEEYKAYKDDYEKYKEVVGRLDKETANYENLVSQYDIETKRIKAAGGNVTADGVITEPTISIGLYNVRDVPVSRYKGLTSGRPLQTASTAYNVVSDSILATSAAGWKDIANVAGKKMGKSVDAYGNVIWRNPSKSVTTIKERVGTQYFIPQGTIQDGKTTSYTQQVFIPEQTIVKEKKQITSKNIENAFFTGTTIISGIGKYSIPYAGMAFYAGDTSARVKEFGGVKGYIKAKPFEAALTAAAVIAPLAIKGYKYVRNKSIQDAITKQFKSIYGEQVKSVKIVQKGEKVMAYGERVTKQGDVSQIITYEGKISKTAKGLEFVPSGKGTIYTGGVATPESIFFKTVDLKQRAFYMKQDFTFASKGKGLSLGKVSEKATFDLLKSGGTLTVTKPTSYRVFEQIGMATVKIKPTALFGLERLDKAFKKGLTYKQVNVPTSVTLEFKLPYGAGNKLIQFNKKWAAEISPQERGLIYTIPKSSKQTFTIIGGGLGGASLTKGVKAESIEKIFSEAQKSIAKSTKVGNVKPTLTPDTAAILSKVSPLSSPSLVNVRTSVRPAFWGTGQYERTEEVGVFKTATSGSTNLVLAEFSETKGGGGGKVVNPSIIDTSTIDIISPIQPQPQPQPIFEVEKVKQPQRVTQPQFPLQRLAGALTAPKVEGTFNIKPLFSSGGNMQFGGAGKGEFAAFAYKSGKPIKLGDFTEKPAAAKTLGKFLIGTLSASGYITKKGKKIKAEDTGLLDFLQFRKSKKSSFVVVEKKEKRLRKGSTGKDIQFFR